MTHGISYFNSSEASIFKGITSVVLSTWSLEGPQPLLLTYTQAVRYRAGMTGNRRSDSITNIKIVTAEQARELATGMSKHVGDKKP